MRSVLRFWRLGVALLLISGCCLPAHSQDFVGAGVGARALALGGTDVMRDGDPMEAMQRNPAGLATVNRPTLEFGGAGLLLSGSFQNSVDAHGRLQTNSGFIPFVALGAPVLTNRIRVGVSVSPEEAAVSNWRYVDPPGVAGGVSYGLQTQKSAFYVIRSAAGVAIPIGTHVLAGWSVGVLSNHNRLNAPYIFQSQPTLKGLKALLNLRTGGTGWDNTFGLIVRPTGKLQLGFASHLPATIHSTGRATADAGLQFQALGIPFAPTAEYKALVKTSLPLSLSAGAHLDVSRKVRLDGQMDWIRWSDAFRQLPVRLTDGNNAGINGLLGSSSLNDDIPLRWRDQYVAHGGLELPFRERLALRAGYSWSNAIVPASTITPITGAQSPHTLSTGLGYSFDPWRFDLGYQYYLPREEQVGKSQLAGVEYNNTRLRIGLQTLALTVSVRF